MVNRKKQKYSATTTNSQDAEQTLYAELLRLYTDPKSVACYTSAVPLLREAKRRGLKGVNLRTVQQFLNTQSTYTRHRRAVRKFHRLPTLAAGLHTDWQADLADFQRVAGENDGYTFLLVCIDVLSRQLFVEPIKRKTPGEVVRAFRLIFQRSIYVPWKVHTDQGREFTAAEVQRFFAEKQIHHYVMLTSPKFHAGMVERANRTIKERLYRYFTAKKTTHWIDVIQHIVGAINRSPHGALRGMRPVDVTFANALPLSRMLWKRAGWPLQYCRGSAESGPFRAKFAPNDRVRIEKHKHVFEKGYLPNFTSEIFTVARVRDRALPVTYGLQDESGEPIRGWFYEQDLCRVRSPPPSSSSPPDEPHPVPPDVGGQAMDGGLYKIEKILKTKRLKNGQRKHFVKWLGYGPQANSWVSAENVVRLKS